MTPDFPMKTTTHESLPHELTKGERQAKPSQDSSETETTMWVMIAVMLSLIALFGYLFWNKF
jgi:hypothetical protein